MSIEALKRKSESVDQFLHTRGYDLVPVKFGNDTVFVAVKEEQKNKVLEKLPSQLLSELLEYKKTKVLKTYGNYGRKDCGDIAIKANLDLFFGQRIDSGTLRINPKKDLRKLPFFEKEKFNFHAVNYVQFSDGQYLAFDLTSHYTMYGDKRPRISMFCLVGTDKKDLEQELGNLYDFKAI